MLFFVLSVTFAAERFSGFGHVRVKENIEQWKTTREYYKKHESRQVIFLEIRSGAGEKKDGRDNGSVLSI
jgi:hypothetical protein